MWEYQADAVNVVDGDTIDIAVDLGFHISREVRLRLDGVDTHETYGVSHDSEEYRKGKREAEFVGEWLDDATGEFPDRDPFPLIIRTGKKGKYGRYIARVERKTDGEVLNDVLLERFEGVEA